MPKYGSVNTSVLASQEISGYWAWSKSEGTQPRFWLNENPGQPTEITVNISELQADEQALARQALRVWQDVANVHFSYTNGTADITYVDYTKSDGSERADTAQTTFYDPLTDRLSLTSATVDVSRNWSKGPSSDFYNYFFQSMVHETGHALGLGHTGNYNDGKTNEYYNTKSTLYANDTWQWAIMSYNDQAQYGATKDFVLTPQMADIYAIQSIYGAAATRTGDSVYGFNSNIVDPNGNANIYDFARYTSSSKPNAAPAFTIYDSSGNDTLDCSLFTADQTINLRPGNWSSVGGYKQNIGIYKGVVIENAVGGSGSDRITGNDVANVLTGGRGNDTLIGGLGDDSMVGGLGNDVYAVDSHGDSVVEVISLRGGTDLVETSLSDYTLGTNVENLTFTSTGGFLGVGNALDNTITGGADDDFLQGNEGNDTLISHGGRDSMIGGMGDDIYVLDSASDASIVLEYKNEGIDEVQTQRGSYTLTENVENLRFTEDSLKIGRTGHGNVLDNHIYGASLRDKLWGDAGNDYLYGYSSNDTLSGESGDDTLRGGAGDDVLDGGGGNNTADYRDMTAKTDIDLGAGIAKVLKSAGTETDTLIGIENVIGSQSNDKVAGDGEDNIFFDQGRYNRFGSSGGVDRFDGGGGSDTIDVSGFFAEKLTIDLGSGTATATYEVETDQGIKVHDKLIATLSHVENVVASTDADTITGDGNDNTFSYVGAYGYEVDKGGFDSYKGGGGNDTVDFSRFDGQVYVDLTTGQATASYHVTLEGGGEAGGVSMIASFTGIENVVSTLSDDTINGDDRDNSFAYVGSYTVDGFTGGIDHFDGGGGANTVDMSKFRGFSYIDLKNGVLSSSYSWHTDNGGGVSVQELATLANIQNAVGSAQADTLEGNSGDNQLNGAGGGDRLVGHEGSDRLTGGNGIDTFVFDDGFGQDTIADFNVRTNHHGSHDVIEFKSSVFADWDHVLAATSDSEDGAVIAYDSDNTVTLSGLTKQQLMNHHEIDFVFA
jgi:serralysin